MKEHAAHGVESDFSHGGNGYAGADDKDANGADAIQVIHVEGHGGEVDNNRCESLQHLHHQQSILREGAAEMTTIASPG